MSISRVGGNPKVVLPEEPATVAVRDLRNNTADVVKRVELGEVVVLTSRGRPVATIAPLPQHKPRFWTKAQFLAVPKADVGLKADLERMGTQDTDTVLEIP